MKTNKITKATFRSFIKRNHANLYVKIESTFDGTQDSIDIVLDEFTPRQLTNLNYNHTYGIKGIWLVGQGGDVFESYEDDNFTGIYFHNSCGSGMVAIKK